jgi:hypothetical protein
MKPHNEDNFLIEVKPEIVDELNRIYMHSDTEPISELHYSPYWKELVPTNQNTTPKGGQ